MSKSFVLLFICLSTSIAFAQPIGSCQNDIRLPEWGINFCLEQSWYGENTTGTNLKVGQYLENGKRQVTIERIINIDKSNPKEIFELMLPDAANSNIQKDTLISAPNKEAYLALVETLSSSKTFHMVGVVNLGSYSFLFSSGIESDVSACWTFMLKFFESTSINIDAPFIDDRALKKNLMTNFQSVIHNNQKLGNLFLSDKKILKLFDPDHRESKEIIKKILDKIRAGRNELEKDISCRAVEMINWNCQLNLLNGNGPSTYLGYFDLLCEGNLYQYSYMATEVKGKLYFAVVTKKP